MERLGKKSSKETINNIVAKIKQPTTQVDVQDNKVYEVKESKTFYYTYQGEQYYFTASNAKFKINSDGFITWYNGDWEDGFFRNGVWLDGVWHNGTFCRGNWIDGKWIKGNWYQGQINGTHSEVHP